MQLQHSLSRTVVDIQIYDSDHEEQRDKLMKKTTRTERNQADQTEHLREEEQEKLNTGGTKFGKTRDRRRTDAKNGEIRCAIEK